MSDVPGDTSTTVSLQLDVFTASTFETGQDIDVFRVDLTAGQVYNFAAVGIGSVNSYIDDTLLVLADPSGNVIRYDDDAGNFLDPFVDSFVAPTTGTYFLRMESYNSLYTGNYMILATDRPLIPVEDNETGGTADETFIGSRLDNFIDAGDGSDVIYGFDGDDTLLGGDGSDTLEGGLGDDSLEGGAGDDILLGGEGADTLDGGEGADTLIGGDGDDLYVVDDLGDAVTESADSGEDEVFVAVDGLTLSQNVENATLAAGYTFTANELDNQVIGSDEADIIEALGGDDLVDGGDGDDTLDGGDGADTLSGGDGEDRLFGGADKDFLVGAGGVDTLDGDAGDDLLVGGDGADVIRGGLGTDTAAYLYSTSAVNVSLATGRGIFGEAEGDTLISIESVTGSIFDDTLAGDAGNNLLDGSIGNDVLIGGAGVDALYGGDDLGLDGVPNDDTLIGGEGADVLIGGSGFDTASYAGAAAAVVVNLDTGEGTAGEATGDVLVEIEGLIGSDYDDTLIGCACDNSLDGGAGADTLEGGAGEDVLIGGLGSDTASYVTSSSGVRVSLVTGAGQFGDADGDVLSGIENLTGSAENDFLQGDAEDNILLGGDGTDTLLGGAGSDRLDGGAGRDVLTGGAGNDTFVFTNRTDSLPTLGGRDVITDWSDGDLIDLRNLDGNPGVAGIQSFVFHDTSTTPDKARAGEVFIHQFDGNTFIDIGLDGDGTRDMLIQLNGLHTLDVTDFLGVFLNRTLRGTSASDTLTGSSRDDQISGLGGDDRLNGGTGNDVLDGGAGRDILTGGAGNDTFVFTSRTDSLPTPAGRDVITDWFNGDGIDLSALDANSDLAGIQGFAFRGVTTTPAKAMAGEIFVHQYEGNTFIDIGLDGDGTRDMLIQLNGLHTLSSADFLGLI